MYVDENNNPVSPPRGSSSGSGNYPPVSMSRSDKADILDRIKPDLIVEIIRHKLMGEELIDGKWVALPNLQNRSLSEVGAWDIANLMLPVSSPNVSISKLKDEEIKARSLSIARTAQHLCLKNWKEYGISGTDQLEFVHQIVFSNTFITLKQPQDGGIRDLIKGIAQESTVTTRSEGSQDKRGFFRRNGR